MDHEQPNTTRRPQRDWNAMSSPPTTASARQHARNKGLAWVSAITLGAAAAGAVGSAAIALALPGAAATTSATTRAAAPSTSTETNQDDSGSSLAPAPAPTTSNVPPVASSGAS
jgi:hypothetical protein